MPADRRIRPPQFLGAAVLAALTFAGALAFAQGPAGQFVPAPETPEQFPDGPNREDAFYFCSACHGFKIVGSQGMSRERWDERLTWMTENQNMPKLEGAERDKILDYLSTAFPERRQPGGWKNPFAPQ